VDGEAPIETTPHSVIGQDLKILGGGLRLISEGNLTVDGIVEGDVLGANVVIGRHGHVNGLVHGETVSIQGHVSGTVRAVDVTLKNGASVEAEVHHNTLSLEMGAHFEGRSRRYMERGELVPDLVRAAQEASTEGSLNQSAGPTPLTS
jgi:cytoskeletal protein CcmA (bactofilin family)